MSPRELGSAFLEIRAGSTRTVGFPALALPPPKRATTWESLFGAEVVRSLPGTLVRRSGVLRPPNLVPVSVLTAGVRHGVALRDEEQQHAIIVSGPDPLRALSLAAVTPKNRLSRCGCVRQGLAVVRTLVIPREVGALLKEDKIEPASEVKQVCPSNSCRERTMPAFCNF